MRPFRNDFSMNNVLAVVIEVPFLIVFETNNYFLQRKREMAVLGKEL